VILTAPDGETLLVDLAAATMVRPATPSEKQQDNVNAVLFCQGYHWRVTETFDELVAAMRRCGVTVFDE
jgi:hypothetical protein